MIRIRHNDPNIKIEEFDDTVKIYSTDDQCNTILLHRNGQNQHKQMIRGRYVVIHKRNYSINIFDSEIYRLKQILTNNNEIYSTWLDKDKDYIVDVRYMTYNMKKCINVHISESPSDVLDVDIKTDSVRIQNINNSYRCRRIDISSSIHKVYIEFEDTKNYIDASINERITIVDNKVIFSDSYGSGFELVVDQEKYYIKITSKKNGGYDQIILHIRSKEGKE